eukprot:8942329-Alexandrium_andersonii.AAC.1
MEEAYCAPVRALTKPRQPRVIKLVPELAAADAGRAQVMVEALGSTDLPAEVYANYLKGARWAQSGPFAQVLAAGPEVFQRGREEGPL